MKVDKISIQNKRVSNQDSYLSVAQGDNVFLGVFDGIGGLRDGDKASQGLRDAILQAISDGYTIRGVLDAVKRVSADLYDKESRSGTTLALSIFNTVTRDLVIISSGDSRIYASTSVNPTIDTFTKLTVDDTVANLRPEKAMPGHKAESTLVYSIGVKSVPHIRVQTYHIDTGVLAILAASDGFWHTFQELQKRNTTNELIIQDVVELAVRSGENDNITAVLGTDL